MPSGKDANGDWCSWAIEVLSDYKKGLLALRNCLLKIEEVDSRPEDLTDLIRNRNRPRFPVIPLVPTERDMASASLFSARQTCEALWQRIAVRLDVAPKKIRKALEPCRLVGKYPVLGDLPKGALRYLPPGIPPANRCKEAKYPLLADVVLSATISCVDEALCVLAATKTSPPGNTKPPAVRYRRRPVFEKKIPKLTSRQVEVVQVVGECKGNFAEAGRRLVLDRKTVKQHYNAALKKMQAAGVRAPDQQLKKAVGPLPTGARGEVDIYSNKDGASRPGHELNRRRRSGKRAEDE